MQINSALVSAVPKYVNQVPGNSATLPSHSTVRFSGGDEVTASEAVTGTTIEGEPELEKVLSTLRKMLVLDGIKAVQDLGSRGGLGHDYGFSFGNGEAFTLKLRMDITGQKFITLTHEPGASHGIRSFAAGLTKNLGRFSVTPPLFKEPFELSFRKTREFFNSASRPAEPQEQYFKYSFNLKNGYRDTDNRSVNKAQGSQIVPQDQWENPEVLDPDIRSIETVLDAIQKGVLEFENPSPGKG